VSEIRESFVPNPVLSGLVGICPLIAAANNLAAGVAYGLGAAVCALALGAIVPILKEKLPDRLRAPSTLCLSAFLALCYASALRIYSPAIAASLWIYTPLLAVSGLSLSVIRRGSSKVRYRADGRSRLVDVLAESILFLVTAALVGGFRELAGTGTLSLPTGGQTPSFVEIFDFSPLRTLVSPVGGFILLGFFVAAYRAIIRATRRRSE
jgi:Na+-translocating ferredoxin:NAD+ oxidoreductase subunit E